MELKLTTLEVNKIVKELNLRTGDGWKVTRMPDKEYNQAYYTLGDEYGHEIGLHFGGYGNEGRIRISGYWPSYKINDTASPSMATVSPRDVVRDNESPYKEITVADSKPIDGIVDHIHNRFWPGYITVWNKCKAKAVAYQKMGTESYNAALYLSKKFGGGSVIGRGTHASFYVSNIGMIEVYSYEDGISVRIERLGSLPLKKAQRIIAILNEKE